MEHKVKEVTDAVFYARMHLEEAAYPWPIDAPNVVLSKPCCIIARALLTQHDRHEKERAVVEAAKEWRKKYASVLCDDEANLIEMRVALAAAVDALGEA